ANHRGYAGAVEHRDALRIDRGVQHEVLHRTAAADRLDGSCQLQHRRGWTELVMALLQVIGGKGDIPSGDPQLRMANASLEGQHGACRSATLCLLWVQSRRVIGLNCLWPSTRSSVTSWA